MACHMKSGLEADPATNSRGLGPHILGKEPECDSEGEQGCRAKAQRLERARQVPKRYGGVEWDRWLAERGTRYHMVGHSCSA